MKKPIVIITGTGFRTNKKSITSNIFYNKNIKVNIGTAIAKLLAETGEFNLLLISKTPEKLKVICRDLSSVYPNCKVMNMPLNIIDNADVSKNICKLPQKNIYYLVHCAGLNTGAYSIENDNPYLPISKLPIDLPTMEFETVVKSLQIMMVNLLPFFNKQKNTKVVIVNSMSGIRSYPKGFSHSSAKAGMHNAIRSLTLELTKSNIFVSEVNPGIVDTGIYDNVYVQNSIKEISKEFGYSYKQLPMMSPYEVANMVRVCLKSNSHVLEINMVASGQWPHLSA